MLLHNPKAGSGKPSKRQLLAALAEAGHEASYASTKSKGWRKALKQKCDLVLVAGGDGTVGKVARELIGSRTPLSVLPTGTANNLARTLGFIGPVDERIESLAENEPQGFDVALARGPWGERWIFEGLGAGFFAEYLRRADGCKERGKSKEEQMRRHIRRLLRLFSTYRARSWDFALNDENVSGRYLLWEGLNICSVGPVLPFAPDARTDDGRLDVVTAREAYRDLLVHYL